MANVFISYGRADRDKASWLVDMLGHQALSVWWDDHLRGERADTEIRKQVSAADAVVALLSLDALASDWVRGEMERAVGKLIPAQIEPFPREELPTPLLPRDILDLTDWRGESDHRELIKLFACCHDLARNTSPPLHPERTFQGNQGTSQRPRILNSTTNFIDDISGGTVILGSGSRVVTQTASPEQRENPGRSGRVRKP